MAFVAAEGRWLRVPRLAWEHFAGAAMPAGHFACHHCDNPSCCNPGHIFSGTQKQNMEDAAAKGRTACGERNRNAKLTARTVHCLRDAHAAGLRGRELQAKFGLSQKQVSALVGGRLWKCLRREAAGKFAGLERGCVRLKLAAEQVAALRREFALGAAAPALAEKYGVSRRHVHRIVARERR